MSDAPRRSNCAATLRRSGDGTLRRRGDEQFCPRSHSVFTCRCWVLIRVMMRHLACLAASLILGLATLRAQNAPAPAAITPKLDTPQVRVYVATLQPHTPSIARTGHATHRVLIYMDDGRMTRKEGNDESTIDFKRGEVRWRPSSGAYVAENVSDHPIRILEIDLKGAPAGPAPKTALDPVAVDPQHYKVEFENEYVRVLRVHFGPHEKGQTHEHILNRVVFYVNDQPNAKSDDVRISGAATHVETNDSGSPADRIAVEIK